ncbi:MAG TPA: dihydropteroate synthase [Solirubrobacteraceae bacterium]|nr:dihydropteroate synthase [Solirubrobacteraceae bacterium]
MTARAGAPPCAVAAAGGRVLRLGGRPWLMGVVNASPDSLSDGGPPAGVDAGVARAAALLEAGADVIDVGGESAITGVPALDAEEEIARVVPVVERVAGELGAIVSVDTYKPAVARAAIAAGAALVNDVSGLRDEELATACAETGAALVVMHTRAPPKVRREDPALYHGDVVGDVLAFLAERLAAARACGVGDEQLLVDPGPDFAKTPAQTAQVLVRLGELHALGRPILLAASRKDFIGALTGRGPRGRLAGTLAAVGHGVDAGAHLVRVHDVGQTADFLAVRAVLRGEREVPEGLLLADELRHERLGEGAGG